MPIQYNPGVTDQSGAILAAGITDFMRRQQEAAKEADQLQYQAQKSDMIVGHAYQNKLITPEQWNEYQQMAPKKKVAYGDGLGSSMAADLIQAKFKMEQEGQTVLNAQRGAQTANTMAHTNVLVNPPPVQPIAVQQVPVPGGTPVNVIAGQGMKPHVLPPPTDAAGNRLELTSAELADYAKTGKVPLRTSGKSFQPSDPAGSPSAANKDSVASFSRDLEAGIALANDGKASPEQIKMLENTFKKRLENLTARKDRPDSTVTTPNVMKLDIPTRDAFLQQAGGDKDKARALARAAGYTF